MESVGLYRHLGPDPGKIEVEPAGFQLESTALATDIRLLDVAALRQVVDLRDPGFRVDNAVIGNSLLLIEPEVW